MYRNEYLIIFVQLCPNYMQKSVTMLISGQIRAGRAFLGWSAKQLAERAGVNISTVQRIERRKGRLKANVDSLRKIEQALAAAGIEFTMNKGNPGLVFNMTSWRAGVPNGPKVPERHQM